MPKYAWMENNMVRDVSFHPDPAIAYVPEIAVFYDTLVPDEVSNRWIRLDDGSFVPPVETQRSLEQT